MICIAGKNSIAIDALECLLHEYNIGLDNICVCINSTDIGQDSWQPSLKKYANENSISIVPLESLYDNKDLLLISLEYNRLLRPALFQTKRLFNIHFSLLPKYKGMFTSVWPLLNGETQSGVTLHYIDSGIDTGDIIDQIAFPLTIDDTCKDLYHKYLQYGKELFRRNIAALLSGGITALPQNAIHSTYYSRRSVDFSNITIDLNKTAYEIHNQLRAFIFPEYQLPVVDGHIIAKTKLTNRKDDGPNLRIEGEKLIILGIDGYVVEATLQTNKE